LFFYIPSAIVVIHLSQEMPLEGGLYQWAKLRFNDMTGFMLAWNLWLYSVLLISETGLITANNIAYATGMSWLAESKPVIVVLSTVTAAGLMLVAIRGLALGKWIHNTGSLMLIVLFLLMLFFAIPRWFHGNAVVAPIALSFPAMSLLNLNILGKMAFGAFSGADSIAVFSGELRDHQTARSIKQSVWIAAPIVTAIFSLGTACVLAFSRPDNLDFVSPVAQNLSLGASGMGIGGPVIPLVMLMMVFSRAGAGSIAFNATSRLPMVAGWDNLLPDWFTRLHPRYKTPVGSILFVGVLILVFAILANVGVGSQESYQLLNNASGICYALTYLVMFAIPLVARGENTSWPVRLAALSGFGMTLLYVVLSVFPIIDVQNGAVFTAKISAVILGSNALGAAFFWNAKGRRVGYKTRS
jgi:amino acid transporter